MIYSPILSYQINDRIPSNMTKSLQQFYDFYFLNKKQEKKKDQVVDYNDLESMTKDELIDEVIKARINTERAKKGYIVKGDGQEKEFISLNNQNLK